MGNQGSVISKKSSRSGSISNPKEFVTTGGFEQKKSNRSGSISNTKEFVTTGGFEQKKSKVRRSCSRDGAEDEIDSLTMFSFVTPRRDERPQSIERKQNSKGENEEVFRPIAIPLTIRSNSSNIGGEMVRHKHERERSLSPLQPEIVSTIPKHDPKMENSKKSKTFLIPTLSIPKDTGRPQTSHSPRSSFSPINLLSPRSIFSPQSPKSGKSSRTSSPCRLSEGLTFDEKASFFVEQLGFNDFTIIYDSFIYEFDTRTFNQLVLHQKNILIIIIIDDCQFGIYQNDALMNSPYVSLSNESSEFMIFSFKQNKKEPVILKRKHHNTKTITTYPNTEKQFIFTVYSAFWLTTDGKISFHQMISKSYNMFPRIINPFHEKALSEKSVCNRLVVLKLSEEEKI